MCYGLIHGGDEAGGEAFGDVMLGTFSPFPLVSKLDSRNVDANSLRSNTVLGIEAGKYDTNGRRNEDMKSKPGFGKGRHVTRPLKLVLCPP